MPKTTRAFDLALSLLGLFLVAPLFLIIFVLAFIDNGSPIFRQQRVGLHQQIFTLVKFRTMKKETANVASHLADKSSITRLGKFLRRTKLDELPQLWNVLRGEMSLVGPRPCLLNQYELINAREERGVFNVRPGITGLAQINDIDMSEPIRLAETDAKMIQMWSTQHYFKFILATIIGKGAGDRVR